MHLPVHYSGLTTERAYDPTARCSHRKTAERGEILRHGDPRALRIVRSDARFALSTLETVFGSQIAF
jgi:hypothetical protein